MERSQTDPITPSQPRRGLQLPPLQTNFPDRKPHQRPQRPRVEPIIAENQTSQSSPPIENAALGRKTSKGGILGLLGRNKSYKSTRQRPAVISQHEGREVENTRRALTENKKSTSIAEPVPFVQDINIVQGVSRAATAPIKKQPSRGGHGRSYRKESNTWHPPPLFQAYPQAVKHATLPAPILSTDAILRHSRSREDNASDLPTNATNPNGWDADPEVRKKKTRSSKTRKWAGYDPVVDSDWTQKVYVLVTSGFFLQYSGEGNFDRLPEKILPLGKDSAAFASDAIPGKQWVLQVAQEASESNGSFSTQGPSSVFKRLSFFQEAKKRASNFLLVIDCPDEMDAWLVAVRKEIESLGGKKYLLDAEASKDRSEAARQLQQKPSQRYLVKRDRQFSEQPKKPLPYRESMAIVPIPIRKDSYIGESAGHRKSIDTPSVSNTTVSGDQHILDKLRETPRMSYVSTGTKTMSTSPGSSPSNSPSRATFFLMDSENIHNGHYGSLAEDTALRKSHRLSAHALSPPNTARRKSQDHNGVQQQDNLPRVGSYDGQLCSPPPNFSVPNFSKRYSTVGNLVKATTPPAAPASSVLPPVVVEEKNASGDYTSNGSPSSPRTSPKVSKSLGNLSAHYGPPRPPALNFVTESSPGELMFPPKSDVPRRFSSLEYSRGVSPVPALKQFPKSPHPPPTAALPNIPSITSTNLSPVSSRHSMQPMISPIPGERNARRPFSMQLRSQPMVRINQGSSQMVSKQLQRLDESTTSSASSTMPGTPDRRPSLTSVPPAARGAPLPPVEPAVEPQRDLLPFTQTTVQAQTVPAHRAPPPKMPPPPRLPSIRASQKGSRGSFEGPWSSGYISERKGSHGVRAN